MRAPVALALIGTTLIASSPAQALDVCSLISQSEISAAMGQPISSANLGGPDVNHDAASTSWTCTYILPENVLVVSVDEFASAGEARKHITLENLRKGIKGGESIVSEEKGIGDRTFLIVDKEVEVLSWTALKGARFFGVTAGMDTLPTDRLKASLRKIATMLLPKL
ncbi:MAG TPA: hypothetical protein PLO50_09515 [Nitrospira sp.]|nr:hypothetical protein [Nitrospira sp.]